MRLLPANPVGRFFLLAVIWLPVWFVVWYYLSRYLSTPAIWIASLTINAFHPQLLDNYEWSGHIVNFITSVRIAVPDAPPGTLGQLTVDANPLIYSWNLPVLLALLFATDERFFTFGKLFLVFALLLPFHAWGIGFDLLKTLALQAGPETAARLGYEGWSREFIALAYQFGYLMLPAISATSIWVGMNRELIQSLLRQNSEKTDKI